MSKGYIYQSSIASFIDGFLKEKRSMGYDYSTEEMLLRRFDQYCVNSGLAGNEISREFLSDWMKQSDTEGHFYQAKRISVVRQLLFYMAFFSRLLNILLYKTEVMSVLKAGDISA